MESLTTDTTAAHGSATTGQDAHHFDFSLDVDAKERAREYSCAVCIEVLCPWFLPLLILKYAKESHCSIVVLDGKAF